MHPLYAGEGQADWTADSSLSSRPLLDDSVSSSSSSTSSFRPSNLARSGRTTTAAYQLSLPVDLCAFDMLDPNRRPAPSLGHATTPTSLSAEAFPSLSDFDNIVATYVAGINVRKRDKCLMTPALHDLTVACLENVGDTSYGTAQFRFWAKKTFTLDEENGQTILRHDDKPVARKEWIHGILVFCHREAGHGGRDKTGFISNRYWSWIPKALVAAFVAACPHCVQRRLGQVPRTGQQSFVEPLTVSRSPSVTSPYARSASLKERRSSISRLVGDRRGSFVGLQPLRSPNDLVPSSSLEYFPSSISSSSSSASSPRASVDLRSQSGLASQFHLPFSPTSSAPLPPLGQPTLHQPLAPGWRESADLDHRRGSDNSFNSLLSGAADSPATPYDEQQLPSYEQPSPFHKPLPLGSPSDGAFASHFHSSIGLGGGNGGSSALEVQMALSPSRARWQAELESNVSLQSPFELQRRRLLQQQTTSEGLVASASAPSGLDSLGIDRSVMTHSLSWDSHDSHLFPIGFSHAPLPLGSSSFHHGHRHHSSLSTSPVTIPSTASFHRRFSTSSTSSPPFAPSSPGSSHSYGTEREHPQSLYSLYTHSQLFSPERHSPPGSAPISTSSSSHAFPLAASPALSYASPSIESHYSSWQPSSHGLDFQPYAAETFSRSQAYASYSQGAVPEEDRYEYQSASELEHGMALVDGTGHAFGGRAPVRDEDEGYEEENGRPSQHHHVNQQEPHPHQYQYADGQLQRPWNPYA